MSEHALHVLALSTQNGECSTNNSYELAGIYPCFARQVSFQIE